MRRHRFYCPSRLRVNETITLEEDNSHKISRVLRLKTNDVIYLYNNTGHEYCGTIKEITKKTVTVQITEQVALANESPLIIHLAQVISKGDKMDFTIQKSVELGITSITPLFSERSVVKLSADKITNKQQHWQKVAISACSQSGRGQVPTVYQPLHLSEWLAQHTSPLKLMLDPTAKQRLSSLDNPKELTLLIGPEGGFSQEERLLTEQHQFQHISLGPRVLRTETAGLATIAALQSHFGDL